MLNLQDILEEWLELDTDVHDLEVIQKLYMEKLVELDDQQTKCIQTITHQRYKIASIVKKVQEMKKTCKENDRDSLQKIAKIEKTVAERNALLLQLEDSLPKKNGIYLKIILGNVRVSILNKEDRFGYKDEYEKFKLVVSCLIFFVTFFNLYINFRPLELAYMFFIFWYYCMLTIRESILKVNGSAIRGWWRFHHFVLSAAMGTMLVWPDMVTWSAFRNQFLCFNAYISFVMFLQFRYQRGQLYRMKALGERGNMAITIEGFQSWMWRGLSFLLPFLYISYFFQLYNAYTLYQLSKYPTATWHVTAVSLLYLMLFIGNITTTLTVQLNKYLKRKRKVC